MKLSKRVILSFSILSLGVCAPSLAQDAMPFPERASRQDTNAAGASVVAQRDAGRVLAASLDGIWDELLNPDGSFFSDLINGLGDITAVGFGAWAFLFLWKVNNRNEPFPFALAARPAIVGLLLANGGVNLVSLSQAQRALIYSTNERVLESTIRGIRGRDAIRTAAAQEAYERAVNEAIASCNPEPEGEERERCVQQKIEQINALYRQASGEPTNPIQGAGAFIAGAFQSIFIGGLATFAALFHGVIAYGLVTFAVLSPITIAIGLIPMRVDGIRVYFAGFFSAGLATLYYSAASSVTASLFSIAGNQTFYLILSGIVNPFIAIGIGVAGFAGLYVGAGIGLRTVGRIAA